MEGGNCQHDSELAVDGGRDGGRKDRQGRREREVGQDEGEEVCECVSD